MPTPRKGTAYRDGDHWVIRATLKGGKKKTKPIHLPPEVGEVEALAQAARLAALVAGGAALRTLSELAISLGELQRYRAIEADADRSIALDLFLR
jgi:hypothetical protein